VPGFRRCYAAVGSAPRHDARIRRDSAFEDLIPSDDAFSFSVEKFFDPSDEVTLEFAFIRETLGTHPRLAFGTNLPAGFGNFIAANMNHIPREEIHHFGQDVLKKGMEILVQVTKEPIATKGPRITTQLSLPARE